MSEAVNENVLNKGVMVDALMEQFGSDIKSKAAADRIVKGIFQMMADHIAEGGVVRIQDFGTFETYVSEARTGRNPQTKEPMEIAASTRVRFRAAGALKAKANK